MPTTAVRRRSLERVAADSCPFAVLINDEKKGSGARHGRARTDSGVTDRTPEWVFGRVRFSPLGLMVAYPWPTVVHSELAHRGLSTEARDERHIVGAVGPSPSESPAPIPGPHCRRRSWVLQNRDPRLRLCAVTSAPVPASRRRRGSRLSTKTATLREDFHHQSCSVRRTPPHSPSCC
jgi:hypothetical protein